jgi:hypothetical protein
MTKKITNYFLRLMMALMVLSSVACSNSSSKPVTLYKGSVASGNSVTNFVNHADKFGDTAMIYCRDLAEIYERRYGERYICSDVVYKDFKPKAAWSVVK